MSTKIMIPPNTKTPRISLNQNLEKKNRCCGSGFIHRTHGNSRIHTQAWSEIGNFNGFDLNPFLLTDLSLHFASMCLGLFFSLFDSFYFKKSLFKAPNLCRPFFCCWNDFHSCDSLQSYVLPYCVQSEYCIYTQHNMA